MHFGNCLRAPAFGALLALLAMPFGLDYWPLQAMGYGIELMVGFVILLMTAILSQAVPPRSLAMDGAHLHDDDVARSESASCAGARARPLDFGPMSDDGDASLARAQGPPAADAGCLFDGHLVVLG